MRTLLYLIPMILLVISCQSPSQQQETSDMQIETVLGDTARVKQDSQPMRRQIVYSKEIIMGKLEESRDSNFALILPPYASREGMYLRRAALESFVTMADAAREDGISLIVISAMRNYGRQKSIWEAKWNGARLVDGKPLPESHPDPLQRALKILEYSSMPGSSRHHWGTDIDINALENSYFAQGKGAKEYAWLRAHAHSYGWCQPYTSKVDSERTGYEEEKWHWSYMPIAKSLTDEAERELTAGDFTGFDGSETAEAVDIVGQYVLGVDGSCR